MILLYIVIAGFVNHAIGAVVIEYLDHRYYNGQIYAWWASTPKDMHPYRVTARFVQVLVIQLWPLLIGHHLYSKRRWEKENGQH